MSYELDLQVACCIKNVNWLAKYMSWLINYMSWYWKFMSCILVMSFNKDKSCLGLQHLKQINELLKLTN